MAMEIPFTEREKRFVVAEAIKTSDVPLQKLLEIIQHGKVQPQWEEMLLPGGRTLRSCIDAYEELIHASAPAPADLLSYKRKSELLETPADQSRKRRQSGAETIAVARNIQPKPAANGSPFSTQSLPTSIPKKRGRPSKADIEARQAEATARGEILPAPKAKPGPRLSGGLETSHVQVVIAPVTPASQGQKSEGSEESPLAGEGLDTPGKKRRGRPSSSKSKVAPTGEGTFESLPAQFPPAEPIQPPIYPSMESSVPAEAEMVVRTTASSEMQPQVESQLSDI